MPPPTGRPAITIRIAIALFDDAEELDWAGPWEVLRAWQLQFDDDVSVFTVADSKDPITCAKGLRVLADHTWDDLPGPIDVLVYPGGRGPGPNWATRRSGAGSVTWPPPAP